MSPQQAIHSFTFCFYALAAAGALLIAGTLLVVLRRGSPLRLQHAWKAYLGWLVIVPVVFGAVFLGRASTIALFTFMAILGFKEYARATGLYRNWPMVSVVFTGIIAIGVVCHVDDPAFHTTGWYGLFVALPVFVIAAIIMIPIIANRSQGQLQAMALAILGFIYIGWMFGHLSFLANADHAYGYLLYLMFAVALNDVAAYVCGKLLGKHKLRSQISPNKTWEGSLGALAFSMALPWVLRFSLPEFGWRELVLTGLIVGLGGQIGDLSISVIKRDVGIKDMGKVLQGHGGILDRVDSLIYTAPLFFHMAGYFHNLQ